MALCDMCMNVYTYEQHVCLHTYIQHKYLCVCSTCICISVMCVYICMYVMYVGIQTNMHMHEIIIKLSLEANIYILGKG